jgi:hypothetical protein
MSDAAFILHNCTKAIGGAEEVMHLLEQKSRLEQAVSSNDPALTLDTSKSFLESIFKTIITDRMEAPDLDQNFGPLYKNVREVLALNQDAEANEILKKLTNSIVHNIGELRNKYGAASHGDDGCYENPIQMPEAEMVAHIVDGMGGFLFRKHKDLNDPEVAQRIFHSDYGEFNDWLDSQNSPIGMPVERAEPVPYSIFLFTFDVATYRAMLLQYIQTEEEDAGVAEETSLDESVTQPEPILDKSPTVEVVIQPSPVLKTEPEIKPLQDIAVSLVINEEVRHSITDEQCLELAEFVSDYARNKAGLDWQNRDALVAKFRIHLRRQLIRVTYSEAFIDDAIDVLIEKAKAYYPSEYEE